jgi:hypothetical protein
MGVSQGGFIAAQKRTPEMYFRRFSAYERRPLFCTAQHEKTAEAQFF